MKGKGKKGRDSSEDECPLQFLDFEPLDVVRFCPRFSQIADRTEDEGVGIEDLDALQSEVESMLVNVTRRSIAIESEIDALVNWQESQMKPKKGSPTKGSVSESPSKRKQSVRGRDQESEEKSAKRSRLTDASGLKSGDSSSCSSTSSSASTASSSASSSASSPCVPTPATPAASSSKSSHAAGTGGKDSKVKSKSKNLTSKSQHQYDEMYLQKNDIPDRFWSFIEPFCAPVKEENVKFLEDMIKSYEDDSLNEYYKTPNRGKHYSTKWAIADAPSDSLTATSTSPATGKSAKEKPDRKKGGSAASGTKGVKKNQNNKEAGNKSDEKGSYGVLAQRLIQSLLDDSSTGSSPESPLSDSTVPSVEMNGNGQVWKQVSTGNTAQIEKKIRKELQDHGLIELEEPETGSAAVAADDDEILCELHKCQRELKMVSSTNCSQLKSLLSFVKTDLQRQEIEKKLSEVDEEVIDGYKKLMQAKSKKRSITKKEKDACLKSLKEREELVQQLDALQTFPVVNEVL